MSDMIVRIGYNVHGVHLYVGISPSIHEGLCTDAIVGIGENFVKEILQIIISIGIYGVVFWFKQNEFIKVSVWHFVDILGEIIFDSQYKLV